MQIVIEHEGTQREVDLVAEGPRARVSDLVAEVDGGRAPGVVIEGRFFGPDSGLDEIGLHQGAVLRVAPEPPSLPATPQEPMLAIVAGPVAGRTYPLIGEEIVVGRGEDCDVVVDDPTMSSRHARLRRQGDGTFAVADLGSRNGTWLNGTAVWEQAVATPGALLRWGATHARILTKPPNDRPLAVDPLHRAVGGLVPFNRPPRPPLSEPPPPIQAPGPPGEDKRRLALSVVSIVVPLVMGLALILIYRDPRFALFMLLSPIMGVGTWLATKRQAKREHRASSRAFREALNALDEELAARGRQEVARREQLLPDIVETIRRARLPSTRLWERRPGHEDFLRVRAGIGDVPWPPPITAGREGLAEEVEEVVARRSLLSLAPVEVDLSHGGIVGVVGDRAAALALARSLVCQAAVHHGPADLGIVVLASEAHARDWDWAKWLPHSWDGSGATRLLGGNRRESDALLADMLADHQQEEEDRGLGIQALKDEKEGTGRTRLFVLDDLSLIEGRRAPARLLLQGRAGPAAGIVVAPTQDQLPAVTRTVIQLRSNLGDADLRALQARVEIENFVIGGISEKIARDCARWLARYEDPELELVGAGLPQLVRLLPVLGADEIGAEKVLEWWSAGTGGPPPSAPIGLGEDGVVFVDLVRDGPHGLIGGTTGSGKSELLRSLVAGLSARVDPDHLVFVLIDYKGGSAFDDCARLPHTVGLVTDLDGHLGERALKSLEAELAYRERLLREVGAQDLREYLRMWAPLGPLPRLAVVIDEFATLAAELPDFITALVGIAQRGRSLGVHLILATQRPSGAVNANIKANTNLRIALRVQDAGDSQDIIDSKDAASISRSTPGRAYIRRGPGDVVLVQTALSTATPGGRRSAAVRLEPFSFGPTPAARPCEEGEDEETATDLARLVNAVEAAFQRSGMQQPRKPWLEMLPERIELGTILAAADDADILPFALADDPEHQRQIPVGWDPADGHLALFGMVGSGTTTAMLAVVRSLVERFSPEECHIYGLDFGAGGLAPLGALPHVGAVIAANDYEAQFRLVRYLRREVERRRVLSPTERAGEPLIVVLIDGIGSFLAEHDELEGAETAGAFRRVFSDGPAVDVLFVMSADRPGALTMRLSAQVSQKVLFRLADPQEFAAIGLRSKELPTFVPGRAIHSHSKLVIQVGHPGDDLQGVGATLKQRWPAVPPPPRIAGLPTELRYENLPGDAKLTPVRVELTLGIADEDLGPAVLTLRPTDHVLIAGPPQSGKTSALALIASLVRDADPHTPLVGICDEHSPLYELKALDAAGTLQQMLAVIAAAPQDNRRWFILVDDASRVTDVNGVMMAVLRSSRSGLHVIAADRTDAVHAGYGHWMRIVRQSRTGVLLQPDLNSDGGLLSVRLPRRLPIPLVPGRGFIVAGNQLTLAQIALPPQARQAQ